MAALLRVNDHTENYREAKGLCLFLNYLHKYELLGLHFQNSNPLLRLSMSTVYYFYLVNPITFDLSKWNSFSQEILISNRIETKKYSYFGVGQLIKYGLLMKKYGLLAFVRYFAAYSELSNKSTGTFDII